MNYYDANSDLNVILGRVLVLINDLSFTRNEKKVLSIERIVIYDFFLKYPIILWKVLGNLKKKSIVDIKEYEINSINAFYPTYSELYKFNNIKFVIQILYSENLLKIDKEEDGTLLISISEAGKDIASGFKSAYFVRVKEIAEAVAPLHSTSFSSLRDSVNSLLYE